MSHFRDEYTVKVTQMTRRIYFIKVVCVNIEGKYVNFDEKYKAVEQAARMMGWTGFAFDRYQLGWAIAYSDTDEIHCEVGEFCRYLSHFANNEDNDAHGVVRLHLDVAQSGKDFQLAI